MCLGRKNNTYMDFAGPRVDEIGVVHAVAGIVERHPRKFQALDGWDHTRAACIWINIGGYGDLYQPAVSRSFVI